MKNFYKAGDCIALIISTISSLYNILKIFYSFLNKASLLKLKRYNNLYCSSKLNQFYLTYIVNSTHHNSLASTHNIKSMYGILFKENENDKNNYDNMLNPDEIESYTKHLANEIYEYQQRLKYSVEEVDFVNVNKLKRIIVEKIFKFPFGSLVPLTLTTCKFPKTLPLIILFAFNTFQIIKVSGQEKIAINKIIPLKIGDTIPSELWTAPVKVINSNNESKVVTLNDYKKHQLIILDFWASWCSSCLESIYKGNKLRKEFNDEIIVIPINDTNFTRDNSDKILSSLKRISEKDLIPFSIEDNGSISNYFPHHSLPHLVWINSEGIIEATSHSTALNYSAIKDLLIDSINTILIKSDNFEFDKKRKIVEQFKFQKSNIINTSIFFSSYVKELPMIAGNFYKNGDESIYRVCNYSLSYFINNAYRDKYPSINTIKPYHYIFSKNFDPVIIDLIKNSNSNESKFTFEFSKVGVISRGEIREELLKILSDKFKFKVSISQRPTKVIIVEDSPEINLSSLISFTENTYFNINNEHSERIMQNYSIEFLLAHFGGRLEMPFINKSIIKEKFTFRFPRDFDFNNKDQVIKYLSDLGFKIYEDTKMFDYLIFNSI